jgi:hypothetical protein
MVGAAGFEPATSCSQSMRAARLRHTPTVCAQEPHMLPSYRDRPCPTPLESHMLGALPVCQAESNDG